MIEIKSKAKKIIIRVALVLLGAALLYVVTAVLIFAWFVSGGPTEVGEAINRKISDNYYYSKSNDTIIYSQHGNWFELSEVPLEDADFHSFQPISEHFAVDKNSAYFNDFRLINSDPSTFKVMKGYYALDQNIVYYGERELQGVDPRTAQFYAVPDEDGRNPNSALYAIDKDSVFCDDKLISENALSFKSISERTSRYIFADSEQVIDIYRCRTITADPETYRYVENKNGGNTGYAVDGKYVYYRYDVIIDGADPLTFKAVCHSLGMDKNYVFKNGEKLPGVSPVGFDTSEICGNK